MQCEINVSADISLPCRHQFPLQTSVSPADTCLHVARQWRNAHTNTDWDLGIWKKVNIFGTGPPIIDIGVLFRVSKITFSRERKWGLGLCGSLSENMSTRKHLILWEVSDCIDRSRQTWHFLILWSRHVRATYIRHVRGKHMSTSFDPIILSDVSRSTHLQDMLPTTLCSRKSNCFLPYFIQCWTLWHEWVSCRIEERGGEYLGMLPTSVWESWQSHIVHPV